MINIKIIQINVMFNKEKQTGTRETETHLQKQT